MRGIPYAQDVDGLTPQQVGGEGGFDPNAMGGQLVHEDEMSVED